MGVSVDPMFPFGSKISKIQIRYLLAIRRWPHSAFNESKPTVWFQAAGYQNTSSLFILKQSSFGKPSGKHFNKIPTGEYACLAQILMRHVVQQLTEKTLFWWPSSIQITKKKNKKKIANWLKDPSVSHPFVYFWQLTRNRLSMVTEFFLCLSATVC